MIKSGLILFLMCLFSGCANLTESDQAIGVGAVGGAALTHTVTKIKEVFTPKYRLQVEPIEICGPVTGEQITCFLIPCDAGAEQCSVVFPLSLIHI